MRGIAVIVTDGKAQGIKPLIKSVAKEGLKKGQKIVIFFDGFKGLLDWTPKEVQLSDFQAIIDKALFGGDGLEVQDGHQNIWQKIGKQLISNGLQSLVVVGGVDGIESVLKFHQFFNTKDNKIHFNIVCIPITIEWFGGTDTTIGVDSALNSIVSSIESLTKNDSKHQKVIIIELKGHTIGHLALRAAIAMEATNAFIEEEHISRNWMQDLNRRLRFEKIEKKLMSFIVVSNNCLDMNDCPISAGLISDAINHKYVDIKSIGEEIYGQFPSAFDIIFGSRMAVKAIELLYGNSVKTPLVLTLNDFKIIPKQLKDCLELNKRRNEWISGRGFTRPENQIPPDFMGSHFKTLCDVFNVLRYETPNRLHSPIIDLKIGPKNTFGITQMGRHSKCSNGSVFSFSKLCLSMSENPISLSLGFKGEVGIHTNFNPISISSVNNITNVCKSHLNTTLIPSRLWAEQLKAMNNVFKDTHLKGLTIIGEFSAQKMLESIKRQDLRDYPNIQIPIALIPSSPIDDIPDVYNLGTDTHLNGTLNVCRNIMNISSETNVVFIVQTNTNTFTEMIAEMLSADRVYAYKEYQTRDQLKTIVSNDAKMLKKEMSSLIKNRVIVFNSKLNEKLSSHTIEQLYRVEGLYNTTAHKGFNKFVTHFIDCTEFQAYRPSALDRIYAIVMGVNAVRWLREQNRKRISSLATISFSKAKNI